MKRAKQIAAGVTAALLLYLALAALLSLLIVRGSAGEGSAGACVWAFACLAVFVGARLSARGAGDAAASAALCAAVFWLAVLFAGFLAGGAIEPARAARTALAAMTGGVAAYLCGAAGRKKPKAKRARHLRK